MTLPMSWRGKTLMWLLVCLVVVATSDDFWSIAMAGSSSQLLIVSDDGDPDDSAERMPACASGGVGYIDIRWFVRKAAVVTEPAELGNGFVLRYGPRGPPADGSIRGSADGHARVPAVGSGGRDGRKNLACPL